MIHIIQYTAWFNIFALALNLVNDPVLRENIVVRPRWGETDEISLLSNNGRQALFIDIFDKQEEQLILSYVLIPWQEMAMKATNPEAIAFPDFSVYTITPFAVIYKIEPHGQPDENGELKAKISSAADRLFNHEQTQTVIHARDGFTSSEGLQIMSLTEYPWYIDVHAAIPGSRNTEGKELLEEFASKMLRLTLVTESGTLSTQWLTTGESGFETDLLKIENNLIDLYSSSIENCIRDVSTENKKRVFEQTHAELMKLLEKEGLACDSIPEFCGDLLERLLFYDPVADIPFNPDDPFPDYVPKMSPDELLDFMPALADKLTIIPAPEIGNLPELIGLYKTYKKAARKNPGEWTEGNVVLGARPREYIPSSDELLLSEIGERIRIIAGDEGSKKVKSVLKAHNMKKKKIKYQKISFMHMDVMGSGRYFYVDEIEEMNLKLF